MNPTVCIKDICLLHTFDDAPHPKRNLGDTLNGGEPLNWSELQSILRVNAEQRVPSLAEQGRLDQGKYEFAIEAIDYLKKRTESGPEGYHIYALPSIYDLVWIRHRTSGLFRGQYSASWPLDCTLMRPTSGNELDVGSLYNRMGLTEEFCSRLRKIELSYFRRQLTDDERTAIAQHFGMPTPMLDFTRSLEVAAFFATKAARKETADDLGCGVICMLRAEDELRDPSELLGIPLLQLLGLRLGKIELIEPDIPDGDDRIRRQQGVFVKGFNRRDLNDYVVDQVFFWQQPGEVFEDVSVGVTEDELLPRDTEITRMAEDVKAAFETDGSFRTGIGDTLLSGEGLIGSAGALLSSQLDSAERFFRELIESLGENEAREKIGPIIHSHFERLRRERLVGVIPEGGGCESASRSLFWSVMKLADWSGIDKKDLWNHIVGMLDGGPSQFDYGGFDSRPQPEMSSIQHRVALACALFFAGWEHVRHVDGNRARCLVGEGISVLRQSKYRL